MPRLMLLAAAVVGACLVLAATAHADETETPTASPEPPAVETAVAPSAEETPTSPAEEPTAPDAEEPPAEETPVPVDETPRPVEPAPPDEPTGDEGEVIAPAPDEEQIIAPAPVEPAPETPESVIAPPPSGAGSPSGGSWPWWPLAIAGAAVAGAASVLLAYQGRREKS
jgi:outer membrane biosynthesis protein TonB